MSDSSNLDSCLAALRFTPEGLIAAIVQEEKAGAGPGPEGRVLMMAWMNRDALTRTLETRRMHYWSRSRGKLWLKGETSGHFQEVVAWHRDCDGDALLFLVRQKGAACHTGYASCFFQALGFDGAPLALDEPKSFEPERVYAS